MNLIEGNNFSVRHDQSYVFFDNVSPKTKNEIFDSVTKLIKMVLPIVALTKVAKQVESHAVCCRYVPICTY